MKRSIIVLSTVAAASLASAGSIVDQFNGLGYGTVSGRMQTLSMYRDYDHGNNAYSTSLGLKLDYLSPEMAGWSVGASYIGAGVLDSMDHGNTLPGYGPGEVLVGNGAVDELNEAYLNYKLDDLGLTNTTATLGRRVNNGEVFRADEYRQKPRSIEAVQFETRELHQTRLLVGHAWQMSNWIDDGTQSKFRDFGRVFGAPYDTDGVTWGELVNHCVDHLEVAVFDAIAYDVANMVGGRAKYNVTDETALLGYYRNEHDIGRNDGHSSNVYGLSAEQKLCDVVFEGGYLGVKGDTLAFQETTTGINHPLGSSMMIYAQQFNGGSDTLFAKVSTTIAKTGTVLGAMYDYSRHDTDKSSNTIRQGQELNLSVKQPVPKLDNLAVTLKGGVGKIDGVRVSDSTATDLRLFVTYTF